MISFHIAYHLLDHWNLLATESPKGPLAISIIRDEAHFKILVRSTNVQYFISSHPSI